MATDKKYHIGRDGTPKVCTAKGECKLCGEHFNNLEAAQKYADTLNQRNMEAQENIEKADRLHELRKKLNSKELNPVSGEFKLRTELKTKERELEKNKEKIDRLEKSIEMENDFSRSSKTPSNYYISTRNLEYGKYISAKEEPYKMTAYEDVGTDKLRHMVKAMRERIIEWGGEVRFGAKVTDVFVNQDHVVGIEVNGAERIDTTLVLSGVGHSARDTYEMLFKRGIDMIAKPFAIGVRIEHPQDVIDQSQYGVDPRSLGLGAAEYSLVYHDKESGRTAYSFCMCPGGQVVASASEPGGVVTNGMSLYARDSGVANSAIVVNVGPDDFGTHPLDGVAFQREWERKAYKLGGSNFNAPAQTVGSFLGQADAPSVESSIHSYEPHIVDCDLHQCLPDYVSSVLERALPYWGRRIKGFDNPEICMTGVETRTSSPLRMGRDENRVSTTVGGFYPMGEGAGYAGGIMSAALDGAETAIACMSMYAKPNE